MSFTVKELLAKQDGKLDAILISLASKADRTEVEQLRREMTTLTKISDEREGAAQYRAFAIPLAVTLLLGLNGFQLFAQYIH